VVKSNSDQVSSTSVQVRTRLNEGKTCQVISGQVLGHVISGKFISVEGQVKIRSDQVKVMSGQDKVGADKGR